METQKQKILKVIKKMKTTWQIQDKLTVYGHGSLVFKYTMDIINHLKNGTPLKYDQKVPDFIYEYKDVLLNNIVSFKTLKHYTILHDCGKPFCKPDS